MHVTAGMAVFVLASVARESSGDHRRLQLTHELLHRAVEQRPQLPDKRLFVRMLDLQTTLIPD